MITTKEIKGLEISTLLSEHQSALALMKKHQELREKKEEWMRERMDKFTSSNAYKLMTYEGKIDLLKGAISYIEEIVTAVKTGGQSIEAIRSADIEHGIEKEPEAVRRFEKEKGVKCYATGEEQEFVSFCEYFGGTPDGLFGTDDLIEVKCPKSKNHLSNMLELTDVESFKKKHPQYYWQIQGNLLSTGRKCGWFVSFDDRFLEENEQIFILEIPRDEEDLSKLKRRLKKANEYRLKLLYK